MKSKPKRHGLTPRQRRFVSAYLVSLNGSEAARAAGYKGNAPQYAARRYKNNKAIKAHISKTLSEALDSDKDTLKTEIINQLTIIAKTSENEKNRLTALEQLGKYTKLMEDAPANTNVFINYPAEFRE